MRADGPAQASVGGVGLEDGFGTRTVTLEDTTRFCAPASVGGDPGDALARSYRLTRRHLTDATPQLAEVKDVTVTDRLGSITLDVVRPMALLVPSVEAPAGSPPPPAFGVDHYQCYDVRGARAHVNGIAVVDEFGAAVADVKEPATLCLAAGENGEGVLRPATHLMCYEVRSEPPRPDPAASVAVVNEIGAFALDVKRSTELCLPATCRSRSGDVGAMKLDIHERDIEPSLCRRCAACCRVTFKLRDTTSRYRRFLRQIGYTVLPAAPGQVDCCAKKHDATVDMGYCKHLEIDQGDDGTTYRCRVHGTAELPELCAQFNCVSWAKANDHYTTSNALLVHAQRALDGLRAKGRGGD